MDGRIAGISASYPYLVYVDHDEVVDIAMPMRGKKAAYKYTLETTALFIPEIQGQGGSAGSLWKG